MLAKSKASSAPSSERSRCARSRASRSVRSRANWTRSSQSTAFVPKVAVLLDMAEPFSRSGMDGSDVEGDVRGPLPPAHLADGVEDRGGQDEQSLEVVLVDGP